MGIYDPFFSFLVLIQSPSNFSKEVEDAEDCESGAHSG